MQIPKTIENLIKISGNNLHCKVLNHLKRKEWTVLISPYYNDNVSDKPREIDLIAEKEFPIVPFGGTYQGEKINVKLFIECKYLPKEKEIVFWFHEKDTNKAEKLITSKTSLTKTSGYTAKHHYLSKNNRVAKLFATNGYTGKDVERDPFYRALNQSLNAMVYYRRGTSFNYPIIICNNFNKLYKVDIESINTPEEINEHFQLEVNYAYIDTNKKDRNEYFLIDVVNYEEIDSFLEIIQADVKAIAGPRGSIPKS